MTPVRAARTFEAIVFDWDGTAVPDRRADAGALRARVEALCAAGVHLCIVSGTRVDNVDAQLRARPIGPGTLHFCLNRGSEVFVVGRNGPQPRSRRSATPLEEAALDRAAELLVQRLGRHGLDVQTHLRLNRRKVDLIPEPRWADPPKSEIAGLLEAVRERLGAHGIGGLEDVVAWATQSALAAGLERPSVTSDGKHVEIGLTDESHSARWIAAWLAERGITGGLILVGGDEFGLLGGVPGSDSCLLVPELARAQAISVGVEPEGVPTGVVHVPGGPASFSEILDEQLARRRDRRVPSIDDDPGWVVSLPGRPEMERAAEAIGTLANGRVGLRGAREEDGSTAAPLFLAGGIYTSGSTPGLLPGPLWTGLAVRDGDADERRLDLRTGVLWRTGGSGSALQTLRFVSAAMPEAMGLRAEGTETDLATADVFTPTGPEHETLDRDGARVARVTNGEGSGIAVAARDRDGVVGGGTRVVERLAAWVAHVDRPPAADEATAALDRVDNAGFDRLLADHRAAWARRWADAEVRIAGDAEAEQAVRFAVFHLLAAVADEGEAAVGARGLSGPAYGGHVFWDADVYVLPVLAALRPSAARAMLEYRLHRLPAARAAAAAQGRRGARFPWESAADGADVTPRAARGRHGELISIRTGEEEEHVVADVAWAASEYARWTGDAGFLTGRGRDLILDTARYWASRIRVDDEGRGHLDHVMGPDEYHEVVDDNAYTNVMARWNLRCAARLVHETGGDGAEAEQWRRLAASLVDGWDPERGLYEQFAGYWDLEPILIADVATPPVAADVLLGTPRVIGSQLIKQADVLMLHHLVPDEVEPGSLAANLAFYEPRTAHGSSLSPPVHAVLLARAGQPERALELFRLAARLDLDDITGTTAGGLHLATMGGLWQALARGFLGLVVREGCLVVDPCLPAAWDALELRFRLGGQRVTVHATHDAVTVDCARPLCVQIGTAAPRATVPPSVRFSLEGRQP